MVHSNSSTQEGFGQQFYIYVVRLVCSLNGQGRLFTFPGMLLLEIGPLLANVLILLQMPAIWAGPQAGLSLLFLIARD